MRHVMNIAASKLLTTDIALLPTIANVADQGENGLRIAPFFMVEITADHVERDLLMFYPRENE